MKRTPDFVEEAVAASGPCVRALVAAKEEIAALKRRIAALRRVLRECGNTGSQRMLFLQHLAADTRAARKAKR